VALALAFGAGCGGGEPGEPADSGVTSGGGAQTQQTQTQAAGGGAEARTTFANTCGGCHTLKAAGTNGNVGPNLDELKPDEQLVVQTIKRGPGVMPENLLQGAEAQAVAKYVAENAGR
jgi:mono/diheme cytochrome c family protein